MSGAAKEVGPTLKKIDGRNQTPPPLSPNEFKTSCHPSGRGKGACTASPREEREGSPDGAFTIHDPLKPNFTEVSWRNIPSSGLSRKPPVSTATYFNFQVVAGGGSRKVTVKSGDSGTLPLTVKGTDVGETCDWRSRGLKVTARPEGVSTEKACATFETRFFCPPQKKSAAGM